MSEKDVKDFGVVKNAKVYGLPESVKRAKYPMAINTDQPNEEITDGIVKLAISGKGQGHDNWLNGIIVQFDLTFSIKAWVEAERYHFFDFVSSQSTMHKIASFDINKQCNDYVYPEILKIIGVLVENYNQNKTIENYLRLLYNIPVGFMLTAGMTTNYRQLKTIYAQRKNHRLPEWREFCAWIETLPESYLITG